MQYPAWYRSVCITLWYICSMLLIVYRFSRGNTVFQWGIPFFPVGRAGFAGRRNLQIMRDDTEEVWSVLFFFGLGITPVRTGCAKPVISLFCNRALGSIFSSMTTRVEKVEVQGGSIVGPPRYLPCFTA